LCFRCVQEERKCIMIETLESVVKAVFRLCGMEIKWIPRLQPYEWLKKMNIRTVLDIGANTGQFALRLHRIFPESKFYCFEPIADCYTELLNNTKHIPTLQAFNFALGDGNTQSKIYRSAYSPSSSLLEMEQLHKEAFPFTKDCTMEEITVRRLDDVAGELEITDNLLIKLDVQGYEDKVISGGEKTIKKAGILVVETSFVPLYKAQLLFEDIYDQLKGLGFMFRGVEDVLRDSRDGTILQCDSIFSRCS